jgi:hypothetical protein
MAISGTEGNLLFVPFRHLNSVIGILKIDFSKNNGIFNTVKHFKD